MKNSLTNIILLIISLSIILSTFVHGSVGDISMFHGLILHPLFLLVGLSLLAFLFEQGAFSKHLNKKEKSK